MKNILSFFFFFSIFLTEVFANSNISINHNYQNKNKIENHTLDFSLRNQNLYSNIFVQVFPNPQIRNWGIKQSSDFITFGIGNISFSGTKNRFNNPKWTKVNPLRIFSVPKLFNNIQLPSNISNSQNYSIFAKYKPKFTKKLFNIINNIELVATWTPKENWGTFMTSLVIPFQFSNTKVNLSSAFATNFIEFTDDNWYTKSKFFEKQRINKFLQEINFFSQNFSFYSAWELSTHPFEKIKFYTRNDLTFNIDVTNKLKYETETRFFYSQNDFITLTGKTLTEPLSFVILPKLTFSTGKHNIIFALGYNYEISYSSNKEKIKSNDYCYQVAFRIESLYWNFTSNSNIRPTEQSFELYNSIYFNFLLNEKMSLSDSLWINFLVSKTNDETKLSCGTNFTGIFYTNIGSLNTSFKTSIITDIKESYIDLSSKIKFSYKKLWLSGNFTNYKINYDKTTSNKDDFKTEVTFEISLGIYLNY